VLGFKLDFWDYATFGALIIVDAGFITLFWLMMSWPGRIAIARRHPGAEGRGRSHEHSLHGGPHSGIGSGLGPCSDFPCRRIQPGRTTSAPVGQGGVPRNGKKQPMSDDGDVRSKRVTAPPISVWQP
jgi:hypothetical protein